MQMMDLEALLRATRDGKPGARDRLLDAAQMRLKRYFSRSNSADDLVQNAMMIVAQKLDDLGPDVVFEPWLLRVARNMAHRERESQEHRTRLLGAIAQAATKSVIGPLTALSQADIMKIVLEEIERLPASLRSVIENELREGDLDLFAAEQGITRGSARSRRSRAITRLRERILARLEAAAVSKLTESSSNQDS
jgi:RNA polymerase sigma factor (sigma-70 family)